MAIEYKTIQPVKYYRDNFRHNIRPGGRDMTTIRSVVLEMGSLCAADSSSVVNIGNTTIICGVKCELTKPKKARPDKGCLIPNVRISPLCSAKSKYGPSLQDQTASTFLLNAIEESKCIDMTELCIEYQHLVWVLHCDLTCINYDGALIDSSLIALVAALKTLTLPEVKYSIPDKKITINEHIRKPMNMVNYVTSITFGIFHDPCIPDVILADPTAQETQVCKSQVIVTYIGDNMHSVHKPGGFPITEQQMKLCISVAEKRAHQVYDALNNALTTKRKKLASITIGSITTK